MVTPSSEERYDRTRRNWGAGTEERSGGRQAVPLHRQLLATSSVEQSDLWRCLSANPDALVELSEMAALRHWTRWSCSDCQLVIMVRSHETPECPAGHGGTMAGMPDVEMKAVAALVGAVLDRWITGLPLKTLIEARITSTHGSSARTADIDEVVRKVREAVRTWPTAALAEIDANLTPQNCASPSDTRLRRLIDESASAHFRHNAQHGNT